MLTNLVGIGYVTVWANATGGTFAVALPWLVALLATLEGVAFDAMLGRWLD